MKKIQCSSNVELFKIREINHKTKKGILQDSLFGFMVDALKKFVQFLMQHICQLPVFCVLQRKL
jgi:hypothetical protein